MSRMVTMSAMMAMVAMMAVVTMMAMMSVVTVMPMVTVMTVVAVVAVMTVVAMVPAVSVAPIVGLMVVSKGQSGLRCQNRYNSKKHEKPDSTHYPPILSSERCFVLRRTNLFAAHVLERKRLCGVTLHPLAMAPIRGIKRRDESPLTKGGVPRPYSQ